MCLIYYEEISPVSNKSKVYNDANSKINLFGYCYVNILLLLIVVNRVLVGLPSF